MTAAVEIPLEVAHLRDRLRRDFTGRLPEARTGNAEEQERNFLTRALAAFSIQQISGCGLDEASASVVDGGGDGGIDAVHYSPAAHRLWVVQTKFFTGGQGEPSLGDVSKFRNGVEALLQGNFHVFERNEELVRRTPQLKGHFEDRDLEFKAVLVYSGIQLVSDDRIRLFEDLRRRFSPDTEYFSFAHYNLTSVHGWLTTGEQMQAVARAELTLHCPGRVALPYETYYGLLSLSDLANLYATHGDGILVANIRNYKGSTEVNDRIAATLLDEPEHFLYLNNGITAYCQRVDVHPLDRGNADQKRLTAHGFSIVNGVQTVGSVAAFSRVHPDLHPHGYVFIKLISLRGVEDNIQFAKRMTQSTNFQNQIGLRDFVALDDEQERIRMHLALSGISYHFKDGEDTPDPDEKNFTLDEATTALACLEPLDPDRGFDFCARVLGNRSSLWSLAADFPQSPDLSSRYRRLFRPDRSTRTIWRAVQVRRAVVARMQENARASNGKRKEFFENARWLVLHVVFLRLGAEQGEAVQLTAGELETVRRETDSVSELIWGAAEPWGQQRHFKTVFCNPGDCRILKAACMRALAGA